MPNGWSGTDPTKWALKQRDNVQNILPRSVIAMAELMARPLPSGGRTPYLTGNLSRSTTISAAGPLSRGGQELRYTKQDFASTLPAIVGTQKAWIGYRAVYAHRVNYGFVGADSLGRVYNQAGQGFFEANLAQWPRVVAGVVERMK